MTDLGKKILAERWPGQELDTLVTAHDAGVTVPYPVEFTGDGLLMQLIGDDGIAAPRLVNARLDPKRLARRVRAARVRSRRAHPHRHRPR